MHEGSDWVTAFNKLYVHLGRKHTVRECQYMSFGMSLQDEIPPAEIASALCARVHQASQA
jgi:hypothetical protein